MLSRFFSSKKNVPQRIEEKKISPIKLNNPVGIIAGNTSFPIEFAKEAKKHQRNIVVVAHRGETNPELIDYVDHLEWIKVGELGKIIDVFKKAGVRQAAMAGGINRVKLFGGVKLDARGAALLYRLRSAKDDVIMRGIASELEGEGIEIISCTTYLQHCLATDKLYTKSSPTDEEQNDISVGVDAIRAMSSQDIGQLVVVREGVIVAVEAVEGSDRAILRGGELGGKGSVVVKFAKPTQDMRFDVPTVGIRTIETMIKAKCRVLAIESKNCLILDQEKVVELANRNNIVIIGCKSISA
ncbi:MAG: UDP-2,3-diacylglucosamine diphosphatase LpxI [Proteobacteria bacterium]|nr:UDP-2,3-diacylglucosamine diphosphatase LpxI [Pseudomonadota bacterium]